MTDINIEDLYLDRSKFVMRFLGVWIPMENETIVYKVYRILMLSLQYLFLLFELIYTIQVWGDFAAVFQASSLLFTQLNVCFKLTVYQVNMDKLKDLLKTANGDVFKPQSVKHEKILKYHAKRIKRLLLAFMIGTQISCGLWAFKPLFDDAGTRKFPFEMWMPVSPEMSPDYELGYAFQLIVCCMSAYIYFGVDSVALSMVILGCAQIDIIKTKIMRINSSRGKQEIGWNEIKSRNYKNLIECIIHHQTVVSFTEMVESAYHSYLLFQLTGGVGLICMTTLRIPDVSWWTMQFASIMTYLLVMTIQLFVSCWCGHELTTLSEELHSVLYNCAWYEQDLKFKRALCFAMLRMGRPMVLRAGHYVTLSLQTFVTILRTSYSYFAVLNQTR